MADTTCPKCRRKSADANQCTHCGILFQDYTEQKCRKLSEVSNLLNEGKFVEAKKIAEQLPLEFPDDRNDFLLLLSNINRDISIVEKCRQAQDCLDRGDHVQATYLLRNIKAFDKKLDERVIFLRRRIERQSQSGETYERAVEAFDQGDYGEAKKLFARIEDTKYTGKIGEYLEKIEEVQSSLLNDVFNSIKEGQLKTAENKLGKLRAMLPDLKAVAGYSTVVTKRIEIQDSILEAARKAMDQERYVEAKILSLFLIDRFPDTRHEARQYLQEIGDRAIITFADLHDYGIVNLDELGLDAGIDGSVEFHSRPSENKTSKSSCPDPDFYNKDELPAIQANPESSPDTFVKPASFGGKEVADFIF